MLERKKIVKKYDFNEFDKYTKKDKIYLIFYLIMFFLCLAVLALNITVVVLNPTDYTSMAFICVFVLILIFCSYLLINYLIIPKEALTLDYEKETITINKRIGKSITLKLNEINEVRVLDKKMFFNVINLGSLYFLTNDKTYRAKYLISPKYLAITLNIYITSAKEKKDYVK